MRITNMTRSLLAITFGLSYALGIFPGAVLAQSALLDAGASVDVSVGEEADAELDAETQTEVQSGSSFSVDRADAQISVGANMQADAVRTESDLRAFAESTLGTHDSVEKVDVGSDHVSLVFKEDARILGIVPVTMTSRIVADAQGEVRVERPWYSFLAWGTNADIANRLEARVAATLAEEGALALDGSISTHAQARLVDELAAALNNSTLSADASAAAAIDAALETSSTQDNQ